MRVFEEIEGKWVQLGDDLVGEAAGSLFGMSVELSADGKRLAVGAPGRWGEGGQVKVFDAKS